MPRGRQKGGGKESKELKIEESLRRLETIVERMEGEEIPLDEAIGLYEEGMKLYQLCEKKIEEADLKITELKKNLTLNASDEDEIEESDEEDDETYSEKLF